MDRVFRIPELVRGICVYGDPVDNAHLALTSRGLFARAIPMAWARVSGVPQLLGLIQGTRFKEIDRVLGGTEIEFSDTLDDNSLSRLSFYAPFITHLEIYKYGYQQLLVHRGSFARLTFAQALLPNLTCLSITSMQASTKDCIFWIGSFSCQSLMEVRIPCMGIDNFPSIAGTRASHIASILNRNCPKIRKLELFWDNSLSRSYESDDDDSSETDDTSPHTTPVHELISRYTSLTCITGGASLLESSMLLALGTLPELRQLEVHYPIDDLDTFNDEQPLLPLHFFPQLNRFILRNALEPWVRSIWTMATLVARLRVPHISELIIEFNCDGSGEDDGPYICNFTEDALNAIALLKLSRLEVLHARLSSNITLEYLANAWPNLEVLRWPDQQIELSDLSLFAAKLPKLEHLALEIKISPFNEARIKRSTGLNQYQLHRLESSFRGLGHLEGDSAKKLYWFLQDLIPNAKLETRPDPYLDSFADRKFDLACVTAINIMGRFLGAMRGHASSGSGDENRARVEFIWDAIRLNTMREIEPGELQQIIRSQKEQ